MPSIIDSIATFLGGTPRFGSDPREELKVKFEVPAGVGEVVMLNDRPLKQSADGKEWTALVGKGVYVLRWIADTGQPGTEYTIEVAAPASVKWKPDPKLRSASDGHINSFMTLVFGTSGPDAATPAPGGVIGALVAFMVLIGCATSAAAQDAPTPAALAAGAAVDTAYARVAPATQIAPPGTALAPVADAAAIYFIAGSAEKRVSIEAQVHSWRRGRDGIASRRMKLTGTAPLDGDEPATTLGDLRGPLAGTRFGATLSGFQRDQVGETTALIHWCQRTRTAGKLPASFACGAAGEGPFDDGRLSRLVDSDSVEAGIYRTYRQLAGARLRNLWSLTGEIGRTKFNYFEDGNYVHRSAEETPWSIEGSYGGIWRGLGGVNLIAAGLRYERAFKAGSKAEICVPLESGALRCRNQPIGAPNAREGLVASFEARRFLNPRLAINPKVSLRLNDGVLGLQVPIYFAGPSDGGLIGGVLPSWNSEDDRFSMSLFVGKAFRFGI